MEQRQSQTVYECVHLYEWVECAARACYILWFPNWQINKVVKETSGWYTAGWGRALDSGYWYAGEMLDLIVTREKNPTTLWCLHSNWGVFTCICLLMFLFTRSASLQLVHVCVLTCRCSHFEFVHLCRSLEVQMKPRMMNEWADVLRFKTSVWLMNEAERCFIVMNVNRRLKLIERTSQKKQIYKNVFEHQVNTLSFWKICLLAFLAR